MPNSDYRMMNGKTRLKVEYAKICKYRWTLINIDDAEFLYSADKFCLFLIIGSLN